MGGIRHIQIARDKTISREHALIEFNSDKNQYQLVVLGKNGLIVDKTHYPKDATIPLDRTMMIQIAEHSLEFQIEDKNKERKTSKRKRKKKATKALRKQKKEEFKQ